MYIEPLLHPVYQHAYGTKSGSCVASLQRALYSTFIFKSGKENTRHQSGCIYCDKSLLLKVEGLFIYVEILCVDSCAVTADTS